MEAIKLRFLSYSCRSDEVSIAICMRVAGCLQHWVENYFECVAAWFIIIIICPGHWLTHTCMRGRHDFLAEEEELNEDGNVVLEKTPAYWIERGMDWMLKLFDFGGISSMVCVCYR
jgi:hypothetical protein